MVFPSSKTSKELTFALKINSSFGFKSLHNMILYPTPVTYTVPSSYIYVTADGSESVSINHFCKHYLFWSTTTP